MLEDFCMSVLYMFLTAGTVIGTSLLLDWFIYHCKGSKHE
jgi:hypothetical protein